MTWRTIVINQRAKLSFKMGNMVVRMQDNDIRRIYLKDISHVILNTTEVSITAALMNELQNFISYNNIIVLCLQNQLNRKLIENENLCIIDEDLCEI